MPKYEVEWEMTGSAVIEADNEDEAKELAEDALGDFATYSFEEFNMDETTATVVEEVPDD